MIKQLIQTETKVLSSNTVIDCGNGDVAIGVADVKDSPKVLITFSDIPQQEVGSNVKNKDVIGTPVVVSFDSVESIKVLNKFVQVAMNKLKKKEEVAKRAALPHFCRKDWKYYDSEFFQMYKSECREDHELPAVFQ